MLSRRLLLTSSLALLGGCAARAVVIPVSAQPQQLGPGCAGPATPSDFLLHAKILDVGDKTSRGVLVEAVKQDWRRILDEIIRDPNARYQFARHPRQFEEFLAGCYRGAGYDEVILTPRSGDLGCDIIVTKYGQGAVRILVQAKAYSPHRRVTQNDVRAMIGTLSGRNASKAIIVTTARFAPGIYRPDSEFADIVPFRLEFMDGDDFMAWLPNIAHPHA